MPRPPRGVPPWIFVPDPGGGQTQSPNPQWIPPLVPTYPTQTNPNSPIPGGGTGGGSTGTGGSGGGPSTGTCSGRFLIDSFCKTDLDIENPLPNGGIPYDQTKDPTIYPATTMRVSPSRGHFAAAGVPASKFYQAFHPTKTYMDFMQDYI